LQSKIERAAYEATYSSQVGRHLLGELQALHDRAKTMRGIAPALDAAISESLRNLK
jgi:hypothetical protein